MEPGSATQGRIDLLPYDGLLLESRKRYLNRPGGYGSGKTTFAAIWHHDRALINRYGSISWWVAPDYQTVRTGFDAYREYLESPSIGWKEGVHYKVRRSPDLMIEYLRIDHAVYFKTTNQLLQADSISHLTVDEADECKPDRVSRAEVRIRCPKAKLWQSLHVGSPHGLGHFYKRAVKADMVTRGRYGHIRENADTLTIHFRTFWNRFIAHTPNFRTLWDEYGHDKRFVKSWVFGIFTPLVASQVYDFVALPERDGGNLTNEHVPYDLKHYQLITGWDFNLGQMAYAGFQIQGGVWIQKLECPPLTKNTEEACDRLIAQVPRSSAQHTEVIVDGDANGHEGRKHGLQTEYDVIHQRLSTHFRRVEIIAPTHNDAIAIRAMATNRMLRKKTLLLNADLRQTIDSLTNTTWENATIRKASGETVTHPSDAFSYPPSRAEPMISRRIVGIA